MPQSTVSRERPLWTKRNLLLSGLELLPYEARSEPGMCWTIQLATHLATQLLLLWGGGTRTRREE